MGFMKRLSKELTKQAKEKAAQEKKGETDTTIQGEPNPPATGPPVIATLKSGNDICMDIEEHLSEKAARSLLGKPGSDDTERSTRIRLRRDLTSNNPAQVIAETRKGDLIGYIWPIESFFACELIDQVGEALAAQHPELEGCAPHLDVSVFVEGEWEAMGEIDPVTGKPEDGWAPHLHETEIRIAAPVQVTKFEATSG